MKGAAVDLPAPLGKTAAETMPLRIERRDDPARRARIPSRRRTARVAQFAAHRSPGSRGRDDRPGAAFARQGDGRARRGSRRAPGPLGARRASGAERRRLDRAAAARVRGRGERHGPDSRCSRGADLDVGAVRSARRQVHAISRSRMRESRTGWNLDLARARSRRHRDLVGARRQARPTDASSRGSSRLAVPGRARSPSWRERRRRRTAASDARAEATATIPGRRSTSPPTRFCRRSATSGGSSSSRSRAAPNGGSTAWCSRTTTAASKPRARGACPGRAQQTKLDVILDAKEAGAFLATFGYPDALQGAPTKIDGQLAWAGAPHEFDYPTLIRNVPRRRRAGAIHEDRAGHAGKLLGVLSLQALPRRDHARLPRRVQRRLRVRRDHRQRAHRERRDDAPTT